LVLTQSNRFEDFLKQKVIDVQFLPNGVDCQRFCPVSDSEKNHIRKELNLPLDKKIVLHVGHFNANRNLEIFKEIQKIENVQVVIAGGSAETADEALKKDLQEAGIRIFHEYHDDISAFYKMTDLYIFPLKDAGDKLPDSYDQMGAIDMPLSVLEAMACNLPVLTTKFGTLPRIFKTSNGFAFCRTDDDILKAVKGALSGVSVNTRQKVIPYHWDRVIDQLEKIYRGIIISEHTAARF
jgi:glycosyltransferase involved in cell wall biosynthesis